MTVNRSGSILAVDFGNVHTRAVLIDTVEGVYQLIGRGEVRTTAEFPYGDVGVGLKRVLKQLSQLSGRTLTTPQGILLTPEQADRSGVDHFFTTASIGRALRTVVIGLVPLVSIASALRATAGTYVEVVETIDLDDVRDEQEMVNAIILSRPDLIFITGGTEGGAREPILQLARVVRLALALMSGQLKPAVLYAGNTQLIPDMQLLFEDLTQLFVAPNVRPTLDDEELEGAQVQLASAFNAAAAQRGMGFDVIADMSPIGVLPTAQSYNLLVDYLGQALGKGVVAVDVGSAASTFSASINGEVNTSIRTDIGLGHSALSLLALVGYDAVRLWLPFLVSDSELYTYALNKSLRASGVPENVREFYIEYGLLRAAVRLLVRAASPLWDKSLSDGREAALPPVGQIVGAGAAITQTGRPGLAALLLLDTLQPQGVTILDSDPYALIPALGAAARVNPAAVVQVLDMHGLERLGVSFSVGGSPRAGRPALRVKIKPTDGETITRDIDGGRLWVYPLQAGMHATVEVRVLGRGLTIGGKGRIKMTVDGGSAGLIFDARGRALPIASDIRARAGQFTQWVADATGDAVHAVDPAWFEAVPVEAPLSGSAKAGAKDNKKGKKVKPARGKSKAAQAEQEEGELDDIRNLLS